MISKNFIMLPSPLKVLLKKVIELSNNSVNITIPQKRKRGRPRKDVVLVMKSSSESLARNSMKNSNMKSSNMKHSNMKR